MESEREERKHIISLSAIVAVVAVSLLLAISFSPVPHYSNKAYSGNNKMLPFALPSASNESVSTYKIPETANFSGHAYNTVSLRNNVVYKGDYFPWLNNASVRPTDVAVDPISGEIYVADSYTGNVSVISSKTTHIMRNISVGISPFGIAYDPADNLMFVSNSGSDNISVINVTTNSVSDTISGVSEPRDIAFCPLNSEMYVADYNVSSVSAVNAETMKIVSNISVGQNPWGVAFDPANQQMYVTNSGKNNVSVINVTENRAVLSIDVGLGPEGIAYDAYNHNMYVANSREDTLTGTFKIFNPVSEINSTTNRSILLYYNTAPTTPIDVAFNPVNNYIYVTFSNIEEDSIVAFNSTTNRSVGSIQVGVHPWGLAFDPVNNNMYVANFWSDSVVRISTVIYIVKVQETGLANGTEWELSLNGYHISSTSSMTFEKENGNYSYTLGAFSGFSPAQRSGVISVNGSSIVVTIPFVRDYQVTFFDRNASVEHPWFVNMSGKNRTGETTFIGFTAENGTYSFTAGALYLPQSSVERGNVTVNGTSVTFTLAIPETISVGNSHGDIRSIFLGLTVALIAVPTVLSLYFANRRQRK